MTIQPGASWAREAVNEQSTRSPVEDFLAALNLGMGNAEITNAPRPEPLPADLEHSRPRRAKTNAIVRRIQELAFQIQSRIIDLSTDGPKSGGSKGENTADFVVSDATIDPLTGEANRRNRSGGISVR